MKNAPVTGRESCLYDTCNSTPLEKMIQRLDGVTQTRPDRWQACCPSHDDKRPSLAITETSDGTLLLKCWAGCTADEIVRAVGLELSDLFPQKWRPITRNRSGLSPKQRRQFQSALDIERDVLFFASCDLKKGLLTVADAERAGLALERIRKLRRALA